MTDVTIYTDASIVERRGWWASVILRGEDRIEACGPLRGSFASSTAVEIAAIANALHHAHKVGTIADGESVELWCDNSAAVNRVNRKCRNRQKTDPRLIEVSRWLRAFRQQHKVTVKACHIRGHQRLDTDDPRAIYNQRCDQLCSALRDNVECPPFESLVARIEKARTYRARREAREEKAA